MKNFIAIIPARSGSKGIHNKNIEIIDGYPLLAYSIVAAHIAGIKRVIISSDSAKYIDFAIKYNAEAPFIRPAEISKDDSSDYDFMYHAMQWVRDNEDYCPEYWVHLRPTTPLRDANIINAAIDYFKANPLATSLRSGHLATESPFKWFMKDSNGYFIGLNSDLTSEAINKPRQSFPNVYVPNGYVDIVRSSHVLNSSNLHGDKMLVYDTPYINEIDTKNDLDYIKYKIKKDKIHLLNYLHEIDEKGRD